MTREEAETAGYAVDRDCYPWIAYKGPRFAPLEVIDVETDLESARLAEVIRLRRNEVAMSDLLPALRNLIDEIRAYSSPECDDDGAIGAAELKAADAAIARASGVTEPPSKWGFPPELEAAIELFAETPTTHEQVGIHADPALDDAIHACRRVVAREKRRESDE